MPFHRRQFLKASAQGVAMAALTGRTLAQPSTLTCQAAIDRITHQMIGRALERTVDTVKMGDAGQRLRGIVTCMFATCETLEKAAAAGANLVIPHEPSFYRHEDRVDWLQGDPVFEHKRHLIEDKGLVLWRCHDTIHRMQPDGILAGMEEALGWSSSTPGSYTIAPMSVTDLCRYLKERLNTSHLRVVGPLQRTCKTVCFLMGAPGGQRQMQAARRSQADVVIIGECPEWETYEYVRDAQHAKRNQVLIALGHIPSEQAGMAWLAKWLQPKFPGVPVQYMANTCSWTMV